MNSKAFSGVSVAACLVLCGAAGVSHAHDGTLFGENEADNTAVNEADSRSRMATPADQANTADAIQVTASIRKAVIADKSLSAAAHNVKIVTRGNTVTLRGPVASSAEKDRIAVLARQNAPGKDVLDQLTVKGV
jgi:osmotically-inducible protein OsmY